MIDFLQRYKYVFFLSAVAVTVLVIIIVIVTMLVTRGDRSPDTTPATPREIEEVFDTRVNETPEDRIKSLGDVKEVTETPQGTQYSFESVNLGSDNRIVTKDSQVVFENKVTVNAEYEHPKLSYYLSLLGEPEAIEEGSKVYGTSVNYYIFASKGITVIGRPFADQVEEIQQFQPTTVESYIENWGENILGHTEHVHP